MGQLFEPFVQIRGIRSPDGEGTGLGLSLVRKLVEVQGGAVGVASRTGAGSCFYLWFPVLTAA
jgi:signal transduction histidine kinase